MYSRSNMGSGASTSKETAGGVDEGTKDDVSSALFERILSEPDVCNLDQVDQCWKRALIPKESEEGKVLFSLCEAFQRQFADNKTLSRSSRSEFFSLEDKLMNFFERRIAMFERVLKKEAAAKQLRAVVAHTDTFYRTLYDQAFKTQIEWGDADALKRWTDWVESSINRFETSSPASSSSSASLNSPVQSSNTLIRCFEDAASLTTYDDFFAEIAEKTGGIFCKAPMKSLFRAFEKTAMRPSAKRYKCDNVYDIVRGNLIYNKMSDVLVAVQTICSSPAFVVRRLKDRFTPGKETSGGWRDALVNGYFKDDRNMHTVEIQIHHRTLLTVRKDLGGHHMYAKFRAVFEALETSGVSVRQKKKRKIVVTRRVGSGSMPRLEEYPSAPARENVSKTPVKITRQRFNTMPSNDRRPTQSVTPPSSSTRSGIGRALSRENERNRRKSSSSSSSSNQRHRRQRSKTATERTASTRRHRRRRSRAVGNMDDILRSSPDSRCRCESIDANSSSASDMDVSPLKDTTPVALDRRRMARSGAKRLLNMSPTRRFRMVEKLLSSSPSRQRIVQELLHDRRNSRTSSRTSSFGALSSFEDHFTPPESPMIGTLRSHRKRTCSTSKDRERSAFKANVHSLSSSPSRHTRHGVRRSPLTLGSYGDRSSCASSMGSPSVTESPMFGVRKSPVTVSRETSSRATSSFDGDMSGCSTPSPSSSVSPSSYLVRKVPSTSEGHDAACGSPFKRVRKNPVV